jgi:hypothetical protein
MFRISNSNAAYGRCSELLKRVDGSGSILPLPDHKPSLRKNVPTPWQDQSLGLQPVNESFAGGGKDIEGSTLFNLL